MKKLPEQPNWVTEYNYGPSPAIELLKALKKLELAKKYSEIIRKMPTQKPRK